MKLRRSITVLAVGLLLLAPAVHAQDCGTWTLSALRGTYAFNATGWQDLSELNPALPKGYAPVSILGAFTVKGNGEMSGWASINAGGVQMSAEFLNSQVGAPQANCRVPITLSMRIKEFEGVVGPYAYTGVIAGDHSALQIVFMMLGTGPGSHVDSNRARRISMKFD